MSIHKWTFDVPRVPWHEHNDYFLMSDPYEDKFNNVKIPTKQWTRGYEYPWAYRFAHEGQTVTDMGCGHMSRPFTNALAKLCTEVWAIDTNSEMLKLKTPANVIRMITNFTKETKTIPSNFFDVVFCIDISGRNGNVSGALTEFKRVVKPDGLIVLTFNIVYDPTKPVPNPSTTIDLHKFIKYIPKLGLQFTGKVNETLGNRIFDKESNLCVYHAVLKGC